MTSSHKPTTAHTSTRTHTCTQATTHKRARREGKYVCSHNTLVPGPSSAPPCQRGAAPGSGGAPPPRLPFSTGNLCSLAPRVPALSSGSQPASEPPWLPSRPPRSALLSHGTRQLSAYFPTTWDRPGPAAAERFTPLRPETPRAGRGRGRPGGRPRPPPRGALIYAHLHLPYSAVTSHLRLRSQSVTGL